jgi:hypothetical protein
MKHVARNLTVTAIFVVFLLACNSSTIAAGLRIGIIGDQTYAADLDQSYAVLQQGIEALNGQTKKLDVVLHVGDMVESTQSESQIQARFKQATGMLEKLNAPWYATAGDHDVNPPVFQQDSPDRSRETLFRKLYSAINPRVKDQLYYSFDIGAYHFVVLYSIEHLDTDPRWGNVFYSQISDRQFTWLQNDLQSNTRGKAGVIVLMHQPMWYIWSNWSRVHDLLKRYPVKAVVAGHFHYNQKQTVLDGINYWVVGATGGSTKHGNPNSGDLQHVTVLTIDGNNVAFALLPLAPYVQTSWTPQQQMDHVQALDQMLGNIYSFPADSPVFLKGARLVKNCATNEPAQLVVQGVGNPLAMPVRVTLNVNAGPAIQVTQGTFGGGFCQGDVGTFGCLLGSSAGVGVANTSIVEMNQYPPPPPLWTATLTAGATPPSPGTAIDVQVLLSFDTPPQNYMVWQSARTLVGKCSP